MHGLKIFVLKYKKGLKDFGEKYCNSLRSLRKPWRPLREIA